MIAAKNRFHGHSSLRYAYQHGRNVRGSWFTIKYVRNPKRQQYRAAVVVSRKVAKSAVVRNRIRRRLYEVVRESSPEFTGIFDMVFTVYSDQLVELPAAKLQQAVREQLQKAGILPR